MPQVSPTFLSDASLVAAYAIFAGSYLVFALGKFPGFKIDPLRQQLSGLWPWSRFVSCPPEVRWH
jgi:hypothetical protein